MKLDAPPVSPPHYTATDYCDYRLTKGLLTSSEADFYEILLSTAMSMSLMPFPKVRVEDVIYVHKYSKSTWKHRNSVKSRHFDFVLCHTRDVLAPVLALELDDKSHESPASQKSDQFKDMVCAQVGLPLLRVPLIEPYDAEALAWDIRAKLVES